MSREKNDPAHSEGYEQTLGDKYLDDEPQRKPKGKKLHKFPKPKDRS